MVNSEIFLLKKKNKWRILQKQMDFNKESAVESWSVVFVLHDISSNSGEGEKMLILSYI